MKRLIIAVFGFFLVVHFYAAPFCAAQAWVGNRTERGIATQENMASGLSAHHPTLPIGSFVKVRNAADDEIEVSIVGNIPRSPNRIIDLSLMAARSLGIPSGGPVTVLIPSQSSSQSFVPREEAIATQLSESSTESDYRSVINLLLTELRESRIERSVQESETRVLRARQAELERQIRDELLQRNALAEQEKLALQSAFEQKLHDELRQRNALAEQEKLALQSAFEQKLHEELRQRNALAEQEKLALQSAFEQKLREELRQSNALSEQEKLALQSAFEQKLHDELRQHNALAEQERLAMQAAHEQQLREEIAKREALSAQERFAAQAAYERQRSEEMALHDAFARQERLAMQAAYEQQLREEIAKREAFIEQEER
ncbi:MAG: hypothetical protein LBV20_00025 [Treponema sp.]|jgi:hypothetical protein|nr:hypothetical protein [Treponema sp.]